MKILSILMIFFSSLSFAAAEIDRTDPNAVLKGASSSTLDRISKESKLLDEKPEHIKVIINDELMPYFDSKYASYKVLGSYLRSTTKEERDEFSEVFKSYLTSIYSNILLGYKDQGFDVMDNNHYKDRKIISVSTKITDLNGQVTNIEFKMRKNKKTLEWKVFDFIAEGVSLLDSKSSEVQGLLRKQSIAEVISLLKEKT